MTTPEVSEFLNREFYEADPARHFRRRIRHLALIASRADDVRNLMAGGFEFGRMEFVPGAAPSSEELSSFVTVEAQAIFHHSAESLLRLFLAHRDQPACPWVELTRLTSFKTFKQRVVELAEPDWSHDLQDTLIPIFLGHVDASPEDLVDAGKVLQRFLQMVSRHYLDGSNMYNAIKHGFAVQAGRHRITVGDPDGSEPFLDAASETMTYLEHVSEGSVRKWRLTTRMMNAEHALSLAHYVVTEIDALWLVARRRYVEAEGSEMIPCLNRANLETLEEFESERTLSTFSRGVFDEPR